MSIHSQDVKPLQELNHGAQIVSALAVVREDIHDNVSAVDLASVIKRTLGSNFGHEVAANFKPSHSVNGDEYNFRLQHEYRLSLVVVKPARLTELLEAAYEIGRKRGLVEYLHGE